MESAGILITEDKHKIAYRRYEGGHDKAVIIAHGFFVSKDAFLLKNLKDSLIDDYDVIMFDFRGHGKSSGLFSWTSKEDLDLKAVLDYARKSYKKIGLIGFSLGAAISINVLAKNNSVDSFISISGPSEFEKIEFSIWNLDVENDIFYNLGIGRAGKGVRPGAFWLKKQKPIESVEKIKCPVCYIHGDRDWVVGFVHSERLYEKTKTKKQITIIKGGFHAEYLLRKESQKIVKLIKQWFKETMAGGG